MKNKYNQVFIKLPNLNNFENIDTIKFNFHEFYDLMIKCILKLKKLNDMMMLVLLFIFICNCRRRRRRCCSFLFPYFDIFNLEIVY